MGLAILLHVLILRDKPFRKHQAKVLCPKCQRHMHKRNRKLHAKGRYTILGKLVYKRCQYECPHCSHRIFPLDEQLSLKALFGGHEDGFANTLVLLCTLMPFGKGSQLFEKLSGFSVSTQLCRTLTFRIGMRLFAKEMHQADELWQQRVEHPEIFEPPPAQLATMKRLSRVYVMADNSKIGVHNGKRGRKAPKTKTLRKMAQQAKRKAIQAAKRNSNKAGELKTQAEELSVLLGEKEESWRDIRGLLIFTEADLAKTSKNRREVLHRRVLGHVGTKEEWRRLVHMALHEEGVYTASEVVIVADGGPGIWELFEELLPKTSERRVVQILDWYHAAQKLWTIGRALKGCKTKAQRKDCAQWVNSLLDYLAEGKVSNVLQRLRKIKNVSKATMDVLEKGVKYFETHRKRMHYKDFRNRKMTIGSGAMESVHAWVFQPRCRLPGMRWSVDGANAIIRLRCSWASGRWDDDFAKIADSPPLSVRKQEAAA